jgi:hypothetical protein
VTAAAAAELTDSISTTAVEVLPAQEYTVAVRSPAQFIVHDF